MRFDRLWVGRKTSCARQTQDGQLYCWGDHRYGQLYQYAATANELSPFENPIPNIGTVVDVAIGWFRTCAVNTDGELWCWGTTLETFNDPVSSTPRRAPLPNVRFTEIAVNRGAKSLQNQNPEPDEALFCALSASGNLYCSGQAVHDLTLDQGLPDADWHPINSTYLPALRTLEMGLGTACGLDASGTVQCWGADLFSTSSQTQPAGHNDLLVVPGPNNQGTLSDIKALRIKNGSTLAQKSDGTLWGWGDNTYGQLGTGDTSSRYTPTSVLQGIVFRSFALADRTACGVVDNQADPANHGRIICWGQPLGQDLAAPNLIPTLKGANDGFAADVNQRIVCGAGHCCVYSYNSDTSARCWGRNDFGQTGMISGNQEPAYKTTLVTAGTLGGNRVITHLAAGERNTCAAGSGTGSPRIFCWGDNSYNQLGRTNPNDGPHLETDQEVRDANGVLPASNLLGLGRNHACALNDDMGVYCWGRNNHRQTASGRAESYATRYLGREHAKSLLAVGANSACVSDSNLNLGDTEHRIYCWGDNRFGQSLPASEAQMVTNANTFLVQGSHIRALAVGAQHSCMIQAGNAQNLSGEVSCWGSSQNGRLGRGNFNPLWTPVPVVR
jgi:alpha-tubulin suppressor-like RCC1 family protein